MDGHPHARKGGRQNPAYRRTHCQQPFTCSDQVKYGQVRTLRNSKGLSGTQLRYFSVTRVGRGVQCAVEFARSRTTARLHADVVPDIAVYAQRSCTPRCCWGRFRIAPPGVLR